MDEESKKTDTPPADDFRRSVLVPPADEDGSDVDRTLNDIKQERLALDEKPGKKRNILLLIVQIIFFPITGIVYLVRKLLKKLNLPLVVKMTVIYAVIFFIVLASFTVFFMLSLRQQGGLTQYLRVVAITLSILVVVVSALYAAVVWVTGEFMLKPIRSITDKIDEITDDNLSARLDQVDSQDELMELTNRINKMLDNLEQSFLRQQNFVADASHELKTPTAVIQGYASMLSRWGKDDPKILDEAIEAISRESENMKKLIEQLLLLARLGNFNLNNSRFNLVEVVAEIADSYKMVDVDHAIQFHTTEDAITVETDKNLLTECLRAIADNAIKYTPHGGRITIGCTLNGDHAEITVADTGIGIKAEDLPHIFERFYRCDKSRGKEKGSSGLGLSIAKSIAETMGGDISVTSDVGLGTTFVIKLY